MFPDYQADIDAIGGIAAVPTILDVVCRTTGMGFAAVARVTEDRWIACGVRDEIGFGLAPGGELKVETTICHEIRASGEPVVIDHVAEDAAYLRPSDAGDVRLPELYLDADRAAGTATFFGTLCAIDPKPARLNKPETIGMFKLFAELIGFHLDAHGAADGERGAISPSERSTAALREQFIAVLGHDLRNPLAVDRVGPQLLASARRSTRRRATIVG